MSRKAPSSTGRNGGQVYAEKMPRQSPPAAPGKRAVPKPAKGKA
jgi:hypothetical protein